MKKNMKVIAGIAFGIIIGASTIVGAATIFRSEDITYSSPTNKTNVKDSLDELYSKVGQCPEGQWCYNKPMTLAEKVELGDYIKMNPTSISYTPPSNLTGCTTEVNCTQNSINPSELNLWRVIKKNEDGTIEVVSEFVSTSIIIFYGKIGYMKLPGAMDTIAEQYTNKEYVQSARGFGSEGVKDFCTDENLATCARGIEYDEDRNLLKKAGVPTLGKTKDGSVSSYGSGTRKYDTSALAYQMTCHESDDRYAFRGLYKKSKDTQYKAGEHIRPILIFKASNIIKSGNGKSADTAYIFE